MVFLKVHASLVPGTFPRVRPNKPDEKKLIAAAKFGVTPEAGVA